MACSKFSRQTEGFISNALDLDIVIDKILEYLPIRIAAQTSVLSRQWRRGWLSLKSLVFDNKFWSEQYYKDESSTWQNWSKTISSILLYHNGPVYYFYLHVGEWYESEDTISSCLNYNHWLSFLSKNGVKKISILNWSGRDMDISSYIFRCSELEHLVLYDVILKPPPGFSGYRNLKHLDLNYARFAQENLFFSLIESCGMLASLKLEDCEGMRHVVIDVPSLKTLIMINNEFESIGFKNVRRLESILISGARAVELIGVRNLASSSQLQSIQFNGLLCKRLAVGGFPRSPPVTFNNLNKLCLYDLNLGCLDVFRCVLGIIESCPYIKLLDISAYSGKDDDEGPELDYSFSRKLDHLLEVKVKGIEGSRAELKVIEYLLAVSPVLKTLSFMPSSLDTKLELEMSRKLMKFPRASPKAQLVCLKKSV